MLKIGAGPGTLCFMLALICCAATLCTGVATEWLYVGTYTGAKSKGIYVCDFDARTGQTTPLLLAAETKSPSFLAIHPDGRHLYAVGEATDLDGKGTGSVGAFEISPADGKLTLLGQKPSGGTGPCHLSVDKTGRCVLVANYGSGSVAALPIEPSGSLAAATAVIQHQGSSVDHDRQSGPHAHFIMPSPDNRFAIACDLGLDKALLYKFDANHASLQPCAPPSISVKPGSGPRHLAFHPSGKWAYLLNEMAATVIALGYDASRGELHELQTLSTLPQEYSAQKSGAEIQVHPQGKFVYASNRGRDSLAIFSVDAKTGKLTAAGEAQTGGKTPRHFLIHSGGQWLFAANQDSDTIVQFRVDPKTGALAQTGTTLSVGSPVCIVVAPRNPGKR